MEEHCTIQVGKGAARPDILEDTLFLTVPDVTGTYTIPYVQSSPDLTVSAEFHGEEVCEVHLALAGSGETRVLTPDEPQVRFDGLAPGEYDLVACGLDSEGNEICSALFNGIGIGTICAALGDSITEGYYGRAVNVPEPLDLSMQSFAPEHVSQDGRNFPQFAPTSADNLPEFNCFESWMTALNNMLSESLAHPVLIANEGWGGYTTEAYLKLMREDVNWQDRMRLLHPNVWLIHLGVNDERAGVEPQEFARRIVAMARALMEEFHAEPRRILVARPSYDHAEGAIGLLAEYCEQVDEIVTGMELSPGPDFFQAYERDRAVWYGEDPVHPNVEGVRLMAELWHGAIVHALKQAEES